MCYIFRDCSSQPTNDLDPQQQSITNPLNNCNSIPNGAGEHYRSNQTLISNINNSRSRGDGSLGTSEQTSSYFSNNLDHLQLEQQQQAHRVNDSNTCNAKGKSECTLIV